MMRVKVVKNHLLENGQSQNWLAGKLQVSPESLSRYLTEKEGTPKKVALAIAYLLKLSIDDIWEEPHRGIKVA